MLIIPIKERDTLDRTLKIYKRKCDSIGLTKELRRRKHYTKPSDKRRKERAKAAYTARYRQEHDLA